MPARPEQSMARMNTTVLQEQTMGCRQVGNILYPHTRLYSRLSMPARIALQEGHNGLSAGGGLHIACITTGKHSHLFPS